MSSMARAVVVALMWTTSRSTPTMPASASEQRAECVAMRTGLLKLPDDTEAPQPSNEFPQ
jgi:hypothetical protein